MDALFDAWLYILSEKDLFSSEFFKQTFIQIFSIYLRCHLSPPEGIRTIEDKDLEKEELDNEIADKDKFKEHLQIIGKFLHVCTYACIYKYIHIYIHIFYKIYISF